MEQDINIVSMMQMFTHPVFLVQDGVITEVNMAAKQLSIEIGANIRDLLATGQEDFETFRNGALSLSLQIYGCNFLATVLPGNHSFVFHIHTDSEAEDLQPLVLTAQCIRTPLSGIMNIAERAAMSADSHNPQAAMLNKNAYQILRIISNMTDATTCKNRTYNMEVLDLPAVLDEITESAIPLAASVGKPIHYQSLQEKIYTVCDRDMLERAYYNLLSNAIKFSPENSRICISVKKAGGRILLQFRNPCDRLLTEELGTIFFRYRRQPGIEDHRHGVGLGISVVRSVAAAHKGTLLLSQEPDKSVNVTMSMAITPDNGTLRSPSVKIDYTGGFNHAAVELSDVLPLDAYL